MILMCSGIYAAIIVVFCVGISLHHSLYIREGLYLMLTLFCVSVFYCISMIVREYDVGVGTMLETMAATDLLPYVRYSRASVVILWLAVLAMPVAIFSITLLYIVGPAVLLALLFFNLTFIALGSSYIPTETPGQKEVMESDALVGTKYRYGGYLLPRSIPLRQQIQNLYSHFPTSAEISSRRVLMHGVRIKDIRTVM